jgi:hypothetical protein
MFKVRLRLQEPTIGIFTLESGERVVMTVPAGAIVAKQGRVSGDVMVDVSWDERKGRMFKQDLRERGLMVASAAA